MDEVADAFCTAHPASSAAGETAQSWERVASGAAAESHHSLGLYKNDSGSIARLLPPELAALTEFLYVSSPTSSGNAGVGAPLETHLMMYQVKWWIEQIWLNCEFFVVEARCNSITVIACPAKCRKKGG